MCVWREHLSRPRSACPLECPERGALRVLLAGRFQSYEDVLSVVFADSGSVRVSGDLLLQGGESAPQVRPGPPCLWALAPGSARVPRPWPCRGQKGPGGGWHPTSGLTRFSVLQARSVRGVGVGGAGPGPADPLLRRPLCRPHTLHGAPRALLAQSEVPGGQLAGAAVRPGSGGGEGNSSSLTSLGSRSPFS